MDGLKKQKASKQEKAYRFIKDAITNNRFKQNTMLVENALCKMLGFSKTPIREALRRLSSEGLVEFIPEKGCFVSSITFQTFIDIFDVREVLEGMSARFCAQNQDENIKKQLKTQIELYKKYLDEGDTEKVLDADMKQHDIIINASGNAQLIVFNQALQTQIKRIRFITMKDFERLRLSLKEHEKIVDTIIAMDYEGAETACREHIRSIKNYTISKNYLLSSNYSFRN